MVYASRAYVNSDKTCHALRVLPYYSCLPREIALCVTSDQGGSKLDDTHAVPKSVANVVSNSNTRSLMYYV